ncbi:hypothetical protein HanLR1_Chr12g0452591 [Helianthus annuus]|nr:hypothetical protein HanLR1_Chr12g0452591 [Helianthus annuus]
MVFVRRRSSTGMGTVPIPYSLKVQFGIYSSFKPIFIYDIKVKVISSKVGCRSEHPGGPRKPRVILYAAHDHPLVMQKLVFPAVSSLSALQRAMPLANLWGWGHIMIPQHFDTCTDEIRARKSINDPNGLAYPINTPPPFLQKPTNLI